MRDYSIKALLPFRQLGTFQDDGCHRLKVTAMLALLLPLIFSQPFA